MSGRPRYLLHILRYETSTAEPWQGELVIADSYLSRLIGWQGRKPCPQPTALLLVPCPSIHTILMRFAIDAVWLDEAGHVLEVQHALRPWKVAWPKQKAFAVLELVAGQLQLVAGDRLVLEPIGMHPLPRAVRRFAA